MSRREYCVTFGQKYRLDPHPASPLIHPDGWLSLEASSEAEARALVVEALGEAWSGLYLLEDVDAVYYPQGSVGVIFRCSICERVVVADRLVCRECFGMGADS